MTNTINVPGKCVGDDSYANGWNKCREAYLPLLAGRDARIAELEARIVWLECEAQVNAAPVSEAKAQGVVMPERETELFNAAYGAAVESGWESVKCMARQIWDAARLNAAPVQQVSVPDVSVMARILADRNADACNVNREDNWAIYGQDYIDDVTAMLETALSASKDGE